MQIYKYDIFQVDLNPKKGHAQAGFRPCVIVQANIFNQYSPTVIIVPLTSKIKDVFPSEFMIKASSINGLKTDSRFLGSQIMTIDKQFLSEKLGYLEEIYHEECDKAISVALEI